MVLGVPILKHFRVHVNASIMGFVFNDGKLETSVGYTLVLLSFLVC